MKQITISGKKYTVGDEYCVWWDTGTVNPNGGYMARILKIIPYTGPYDFIKCIFRLTSMSTSKGYTHMSIEG